MALDCASCPVRSRAACSVLSDSERANLARTGRVRKLQRGELFAPFAHHDVVALTDSELCVFPRSEMGRAVDLHPRLAQALLRRTEEDLLQSRELLALSGKRGAASKVAGLLLGLAGAASDSSCHPAGEFDLPLTRGEIAGMLGVTIETVSRSLTRFEHDGLIRRKGARGIELIDPARLGLAAEGRVA